MKFTWREFVRELAKQPRNEVLKTVQLSQAILESGRGSSRLFTLHGNPYGMKYRDELSAIASCVTYAAWDGVDTYCEFKSVSDAVNGYWEFIARSPYKGWESAIASPHTFITFIANAGYIGGSQSVKNEYIAKVVRLFPESQHILQIV